MIALNTVQEGQLEVKYSTRKQLAALIGCIAGMMIFVWMAKTENSSSMDIFVAWFGILLCGSGLIYILKNIFRKRGNVLIVNTTGITNLRASDITIPWSAIKAVSTWVRPPLQAIIIKLDPIFEATYPVKGKGGWADRMSKRMGIDGMPILTNAFAISHDELLWAIQRFKQRHDDAARNA